MHALTVLFTSLSLLGSLGAAQKCCNGGTDDPSKRCKEINKDSFCCSTRDFDGEGGCDGVTEFPTGRTIILDTGGSCTSGEKKLPGSIVCA
ncbi:hypothetical protein LZ30DRAFT_611270 [Colletotrichum cereale]|nr:hypothetical protein LZ30DRAFT_611270 [Colletotrichum cereale]